VGDGKAIIIAVVVVAAVGTVVLAATEGMRFDGWASLHEGHPIRLTMRDGSEKVVPLWQLSARDIDESVGAYVAEVDEEVALEERHPLDRVGFVWRMEGGTVQLDTPDDQQPFFPAAIIQFGYYPLQELGLVLSTALSWGEQARGDVIAVQYGVEIDVLPLALGRFHLGGYLAGLMSYTATDGGRIGPSENHDPSLQVGVLGEIDLTTRLGLTMRAGAHWQHRNGAFLSPAFLATAVY